VGTYHKVLTVFFGRVFKVFGAVSNRRVIETVVPQVVKGLADRADIEIQMHSMFDFEALRDIDYVGLHVIRDPRDLLVSCAFYHQRSSEAWLHEPSETFGGLTYQQYTNSLATVEDRLIFEIDHAGGFNIRHMLDWDYGSPKFAEMRYEQLIGDDAAAYFEEKIAFWPLTPVERDVLVQIFRYFSLKGPGTKGSKHIRNPNSGQWRRHFTDRVQAHFDKVLPDAASILGYD
jgi:hypothetical protein